MEKRNDYNIIPKKMVDAMVKDRKVRVAITKESHLYFFHFYFAHYVQYPTAEFQHEIIRLTEDETVKNMYIVAFRGSGKSTYCTTSYPLWAIFGQSQKKFVMILCQTRNQAKQHMMNLRRELESNTILKRDFGPFQEEKDEWGSGSLVFTKLNARITVASTEQSIRGLRHNQHRPDLIICDDVEDMASTKTREGRQKTYQWLTGEVIPAGDRNTKLVIVGNLLHEDSLLMRIANDVRAGKLDGEFRAYPLIDKRDNILWAGKYPTKHDIETERKKLGNDIAWQREFLLHIVPDEDQVVYQEWIRYHGFIRNQEIRHVVMAVDLAISQKDTADFTAMVVGLICGYEDTFRVYVLPRHVNKRMNFPETIAKIKKEYGILENLGPPTVLVEDVAYQRAVVDQLKHDGLRVEGIKVSGDKRSRLMTVTPFIQNGKITFPQKGAEQLIEQIVGFGVEKHDDLVDAFTLLAHQAIKKDTPPCRITWLC